MRLLEVFKPNVGVWTPKDGRWNVGYNARSRECGVHLRLVDACAETYVDMIGTAASRPVEYHVGSFPIQLLLQRATWCMLPDDESWALQALESANEYAISRALVVQPVSNTDTWTGATGVQEVALAATPTPAALAAAVVAARKLWYATVIGGPPVFHIPPSLVPDLIAANVLVSRAIDGEIAEVWGDTVIVAAGYETANPRAFFTGPIGIHLAPARDDSPVMYFRLNDSVVMVDEVAAIDVPPCSIVRVGSY